MGNKAMRANNINKAESTLLGHWEGEGKGMGMGKYGWRRVALNGSTIGWMTGDIITYIITS
jgi:hypothetical protein